MQSIEEAGWDRGIDPYGMHQEALAWAAAQIGEGEVLEVGAGWWSTPWLHGFCEATERELTTLERDGNWLIGIAPVYGTYWHNFAGDLPDEFLSSREWALALVDGGDPDRARYINLLRGHCQFLVCHDTEETSRIHYPGMEEALAEWPNRRDFARLWPNATVVWA